MRNPTDLDYLWCEFFLTGNVEAIRKIIEVLKWPDRIRSRLNRWLQDPTHGALSVWRKKRIAKQLAHATGIVCDVHAKSLETDDDLDCLCFAGRDIRPRNAEEFGKLRAALPIELSDDDANYIATKGAAKWSLFLRPRVFLDT